MREPRVFRPTTWVLLEERVLPSLIGEAPGPSPVIPFERSDAYGAFRHAENLQQARPGDANVVFLGDSITDFWGDSGRQGVGSAVWEAQIAPLRAANFGVGGDTTENVLWRIGQGELAGAPKVVVLEIGTNNIGSWGDTVAETTAGVTAVVETIHAASPGSQILLMGILPRGGGVSDPMTQEAFAVNAQLAGLADGAHVHFLDIGTDYLNPDGTINRLLLPDALHPSALGYQIWANALAGPIDAMLVHDDAPAPAPGGTAGFATDTASGAIDDLSLVSASLATDGAQTQDVTATVGGHKTQKTHNS